jgi:HD-GYP domain-containing protein (c-di-GMP phosphodiesterase class II)
MAQNPTFVPTQPKAEAIPLAVLEEIATHARGDHLCLALLKTDGTLAWSDAMAGAFFDHYVIRALADGPAARALCERAGHLAAGAAAQSWELLPGVMAAAVPLMQRRQLDGTLLLMGISGEFSADNEELLRLCGQMGLDATFLALQAGRMGRLGARRLATQAELFALLLRDRSRAAGLEEELHTLSSQLSNAYEELTLIDQISSGMRVNRRSGDFFRQACLDVMQVISVKGMGVALRNDRTRPEPALYGEVAIPMGQVHRLAEQLLTMLQDRKSFLLVNDVKADRNLHWAAEFTQQLLAVPLQRGDHVLGCLFALDKNVAEFDSVDLKLLTSISNECAIYLENAILFGDVHAIMMGLLHSLTSAVDAKDAYTCGHSERVALLSRHLAAKTGLSDGEVERIYMAGLLHDVGKIGVPESVLQKTGRLTAEEFEHMKKHPQIGARILADVKQLEDIIPGVLYHHERFDGKGYPTGLSGRDIPLMGRIICLADCFDAMTSNRTYRKALPIEVALTEIRRCSGTQFDPTLADSFLQITPEQFRHLLRDHQHQAKKLLELQETLRAA